MGLTSPIFTTIYFTLRCHLISKAGFVLSVVMSHCPASPGAHGGGDVKYAVVSVVCCDVTECGIRHRTETGSGLDKNPRIQNLELSTSTGALRVWASLSSSFSSLSLFSSSLTLKLNEVSERKTILNAQSWCQITTLYLRLE